MHTCHFSVHTMITNENVCHLYCILSVKSNNHALFKFFVVLALSISQGYILSYSGVHPSIVIRLSGHRGNRFRRFSGDVTFVVWCLSIEALNHSQSDPSSETNLPWETLRGANTLTTQLSESWGYLNPATTLRQRFDRGAQWSHLIKLILNRFG